MWLQSKRDSRNLQLLFSPSSNPFLPTTSTHGVHAHGGHADTHTHVHNTLVHVRAHNHSHTQNPDLDTHAPTLPRVDTAATSWHTCTHGAHTHTRAHTHRPFPQKHSLPACCLGGFAWPSDPSLQTPRCQNLLCAVSLRHGANAPRVWWKSASRKWAITFILLKKKTKGRKKIREGRPRSWHQAKALTLHTTLHSLPQASDDKIKAQRGSVTHRR